jgi:hypothetical protein
MDLFIYRLVLLIRCGGDAAGLSGPPGLARTASRISRDGLLRSFKKQSHTYALTFLSLGTNF